MQPPHVRLSLPHENYAPAMLAPCPDSKDCTALILAGARCQARTIWEEFPTVGRKWHLGCRFKLLSAASDVKQTPFETALWESTPERSGTWHRQPKLFLVYPPTQENLGNPLTQQETYWTLLIANSLRPLINPCLLEGFSLWHLLTSQLPESSTSGNTQVSLLTLLLVFQQRCV